MTGKAILFTSGKGGVGKTTSTANIAAALALQDPKLNICMIDMDLGLRNLDIQFGLENRVIHSIVDYLNGECKLKQALIKDKRLSNLFLLPAAQSSDKTAINPEQMHDLISELKEQFDLVLLDCPAGIEQGFHNAAIATDEALIITNPEMSAVRDADRVIGLLQSMPRKVNCWLIINRLNPKMVQAHQMMSVEDILDILGVKLFGVIPDDPEIIVSVNQGEPLALNMKNNWAGQAYRNIARRLTGHEVPLLDLFGQNRNIFVKQINKLKAFIMK